MFVTGNNKYPLKSRTCVVLVRAEGTKLVTEFELMTSELDLYKSYRDLHCLMEKRCLEVNHHIHLNGELGDARSHVFAFRIYEAKNPFRLFALCKPMPAPQSMDLPRHSHKQAR